jgi:hypothetical protein
VFRSVCNEVCGHDARNHNISLAKSSAHSTQKDRLHQYKYASHAVDCCVDSIIAMRPADVPKSFMGRVGHSNMRATSTEVAIIVAILASKGRIYHRLIAVQHIVSAPSEEETRHRDTILKTRRSMSERAKAAERRSSCRRR